MLWETFNIMRDLSRLHDITTILIRYGLGDMVRAVGLGNVLERAGRILRWQENEEIAKAPLPVKVRRALEELGPTFVKLGQVLATRVDVFTPEWIAEFEKLQSNVPAVPFELIRPEMEEALGASPFDVFDDLQTEPVAAASIAQVYFARLKSGEAVAIKVRRPGVTATIEADLRILAHIATLVELEVPESRRYHPVQIVAQFSKSLARELDLAVEARNIERFATHFAQDENVLIPRVYWEWTSEIMNVQERVEGIPGNDLARVEREGLDRRMLAARGANTVLKMILVDGYFHADPHPGNVFYLPGNRLAILDFGMVGRLSDARRNQIVDLLAALSRRDDDGTLDVLLEWAGDAAVDDAKLAADVNELVANYEDIPLKEVRFGVLLGEIAALMREHSLVLPPDLTLLFKTLVTLEGLGRQLDPDFHMVEHLGPFVRKVITLRYSPDALQKRARRHIHDVFSVLTGLPRDVSRLVKEARRGRFRIDLDLKRLDHFGHQLDRSTNRLTMGILTASLVIGSSIVMTVKAGPTLFGLPLFGFLGFLLAFMNSVWILFSIWRSGKE